MEDGVANSDAQVDLLVTIAGVSVEEASEALEKCNGDVDRAMEKLLDDQQDSSVMPKKKSKPAPDTGRGSKQPVHHHRANPQFITHQKEELEDDSLAKPDAPKYTIPALKAVDSRAVETAVKNEMDVDSLDESAAPPSASSLLMAVASSISSPRPSVATRPAQVTQASTPGAIAVAGINAHAHGGRDDHTFTASVTTIPTTATPRSQSTLRSLVPVTARNVLETEQDIEELQDQLRQQHEELEHAQVLLADRQHVAVAEVIEGNLAAGLDEGGPPSVVEITDKNNDQEPTTMTKQLLSSPRVKWGAIIGIVLVIVAIVVAVVAIPSNSAKINDPTSSNVGSTNGNLPTTEPKLSPSLELQRRNPTVRETPRPTRRPTPRETPHPTRNPTAGETPRPTRRPTPRETPRPTRNPTAQQTPRPTRAPTRTPTRASPTCPPTPKNGAPYCYLNSLDPCCSPK